MHFWCYNYVAETPRQAARDWGKKSPIGMCGRLKWQVVRVLPTLNPSTLARSTFFLGASYLYTTQRVATREEILCISIKL